jgi:hypothetical protein
MANANKIKKADDPLYIALAQLRIADYDLQMDIQQGKCMGVIQQDMGKIYRALGAVEEQLRGRRNVSKEISAEIVDFRKKYPKHA